MSVKLPVEITYNGKGAKNAQKDLQTLAKEYVKNTVTAKAAYELAKRSIMAANEDAASQRQLALALRNSAGANDYAVAKTEKFISQMQYTALVADDKLRPALATLATVTHDTAKAQDLLKVALDVSAAKGIDVENVATALSKAYQGNVGALRRMGLAISDTAIKNKDFASALDQVKMATAGAAAEATKSADGAWKRLNLVGQDLLETFGYELNDTFGGYIALLGKAGQKAVEAQQDQGLLGKVIDSLKQSFITSESAIIGMTRALAGNTKASKDNSSAQEALISRNNTALALQGETIRRAEQETQAREKANKVSSVAAARAAELARANREKLASALLTAKDAVKAVKDEMASYAAGIRDVINGTVSLYNAYSTAQDQEDAYQAALKDRAAAYAELAKLQQTTFDVATGKTTVANAEDLAAAIERVAKAEEDVKTAQAGKKSYSQQFAEQVAAAKAFSTDLQALIGAGLQAPGIQQLLNMGPIAGDAVAKDLLAGVGGLTIGGLNQDLAAVSAGGQALGDMTGGLVYGADLTAAQNRAGAVQYAVTNNITVTSADPDKVVAALVAWSKKNGKLPSTIVTAA